MEIRRGEGAKSLALFLYFFCLMASYYVIKPVRNSIFLEELGPRQLPYAYLATAVVIGFVASGYTRLVARFERHWLIMASMAFFILNLLLFWWIFRFDIAWMAGLFYLWAAVFSVGAVTQFWSMSNEVFNPEEAKRLFGFIGSGGILGGTVGGTLSSLLSEPLGTQNLLLLSALMLLPCLLLVYLIHRMERRVGLEAAPARRAEAPLTGHRVGLKVIARSEYLRLLALMMVVMVIVATLVDYAFNTEAARAFPGGNAKTAFFGAFFAAVSALSLFVQFFLTSPILRAYGVGATLLLLPVLLGASSFSVLLIPALWSVSALKLADGSLRYSLNQSTREILFLPVPLVDKYSAKAVIDMSLQRWARGLAAFIILAVIALDLSWTAVAMITLLFCAAWAWIVILARDQYLASLTRLVGERPISPEAQELRPPRDRPPLTERATAALAAAERLLAARTAVPPPPDRTSTLALEELLTDERPEVRLHALRSLTAQKTPPPRLPQGMAAAARQDAVRRGAWALVVRADYEAARGGQPKKPPDMLERALEKATFNALEEALLWQALSRPRPGHIGAVRGLRHWAKELRATSQELLESNLPPEAKKLLRLVTSERPVVELAASAASVAGIGRQDFSAWIPALLGHPSPEVRLAATYATARLFPGRYGTELTRLADHGTDIETALARAALASKRRQPRIPAWT
ncbi:MAG: Npt1/Npt2 family nucleotide transporter [Pseudomonadota bacterium]